MIPTSNGQGRPGPHEQESGEPDNLWPQASETFVITPQIKEMTERAIAYLDAGYPINLAGPAGTGKTTLALHIASQRSRPVTLMHGDDEAGSSDLVGSEAGFRKNRLVDNYIHSVLKEQETMRALWVDNRLTTACRYGHTLVYDEFTRSRPEANNVLLSVLGEGLLNLPKLRYEGEGYLEVDEHFRAIFTSNPEEYAGIHKSQDALMDRLISIHVGHYDRETEIEITAARSGTAVEDAARVVDLVRAAREKTQSRHGPSIRAAIMIAKVVMHRGARFHPTDTVYQRTCLDVLGLEIPELIGRTGESLSELVSEDFEQPRDEVETGEQELVGAGVGESHENE